MRPEVAELELSEYNMGVTPHRVTTSTGLVVERKESLRMSLFGGLVPCAPYDDHFIYATSELYQSAYMCTCGSPAVAANLGGTGVMLVCLYHMYVGVHATGGRSWI